MWKFNLSSNSASQGWRCKSLTTSYNLTVVHSSLAHTSKDDLMSLVAGGLNIAWAILVRLKTIYISSILINWCIPSTNKQSGSESQTLFTNLSRENIFKFCIIKSCVRFLKFSNLSKTLGCNWWKSSDQSKMYFEDKAPYSDFRGPSSLTNMTEPSIGMSQIKTLFHEEIVHCIVWSKVTWTFVHPIVSIWCLRYSSDPF